MLNIITGKSAIWIGRGLVVVSLVFVAFRLWDYRSSVEEQLASPKLLISTLIASGIYAVSGFFLALGWWLILGSRTSWGERLAWKSAWRIYGKTQIAKYIPGNVFHFAGRHALAAKHGVSHSQLVMAASGEIAMMLTAGGFFSFLGMGILLERIPHSARLIAIMIGCGCVGSVLLGFICRRFELQNVIRAIAWRKVIAAELSYCWFFAVSILLFLFLLFQLSGPLSNWPLIAGGYALAWVIGFVVPGAPGGLGVREAMLLTFLSGAVEEKSLLIAAILFRVATTLGDALFFLIAQPKQRSAFII